MLIPIFNKISHFESYLKVTDAHARIY